MPKCGASFKKPVSEISDRAKRYRANHPDCKPKGKFCETCGSRKNLLVGHRDGNESNGRPYNLGTFCKSCNTADGKAMAKAGKGVRTRQYNPTKNPHRYIRQYGADYSGPTSDKYSLWERPDNGGPARRVGTAHSQAEAYNFIEGAPVRKKRVSKQLSLFGKNPGAVNLAQYVQAAVDHTRGAHDAGGKVIHETPKAKRREFAREIAFRKGYGRNPRKKNMSPADELYRKFHGRGPDKITTMLVAGVDPYGGHRDLTSLGPLIRLVVGEDIELSDDGEVLAADDVTEITFVPSMREYRRITESLDTKNAEELRKFKAWLKSVGAPDVAAVPNTRQLYFIGGKQSLDDAALKALGCDPEKDLCDLGDCFLIEYFAQKRFDQFQPMTYFHALGEITHVQPRLIYRKPQRMLELVGGEYVVKAAGIDN
jgi:hypothetical protein